MLSEGFSKGPWKVELADPPCIVSYDGETVVDLPVWIPEFRGERDANANLIAAAPDLYDALEAVLPILEQQVDDAQFDYGAFVQEGGGVPPVAMSVAQEETYERFAKAQRALAKARGQA